MMYLDAITYLPNDILVGADRASMKVGLEVRAPDLDHRVVKFARKLHPSMKIRDGRGKWLRRRVLDRYVPRELIDRPEAGFGLPVHSRLRGSPRVRAAGLLAEDHLCWEGIFDPIRKRRKDHLSGRRNCRYQLWSILMFQTWYEAPSRDRS